MRSSVSLVLLGIAALGTSAQHNHRHQHAHLHARDYDATVVEVVTDYVTEYVTIDDLETTSSTTPTPTPTPTPSTSSTETPTPSADEGAAAALFEELPVSSSSTTPSPSPTPIETPTTSSLAGPSTQSPVSPSTTSTPSPSTTAYPSTSAPAAVETVNGERIFTIVNSHTAAVSTSHDDTVGTPTSNGVTLTPGTIAAGATVTFAVPSGWIGNIAFNDADYEITTDCSLVEANYVEWYGALTVDYDISFVNGFSLPATCSCSGSDVVGCNLDLASLSACPEDMVENACANPLRSDEDATAAAPFFEPCQGAAWTFVNDGDAEGTCVDGEIVCCIGAACAADPDQEES